MSVDKIIYGTDRNLIKYEFKIINESDTYYEVRDVSTSNYELGQNIFYVNKDPLEMTKSSDKSWEFIFKNKGFKISFDQNDIIRYATELQIEACESNLASNQELLILTQRELNDLDEVTECEDLSNGIPSLTYNESAIAKCDDLELQLIVDSICKRQDGSTLPIFKVNGESELMIPEFDAVKNYHYIYKGDTKLKIYLNRDQINKEILYYYKQSLIDKIYKINAYIFDYRSRLHKLKDSIASTNE